MNHLYFGDNLDVLRRSIPSESADLVYLDPPFNSKAGTGRTRATGPSSSCSSTSRFSSY